MTPATVRQLQQLRQQLFQAEPDKEVATDTNETVTAAA
jgi:hypothetical protein